MASFGSIFVNGFEFDLTGVPITIDDQSGTEGDLHLGQVVTVTTNIGSDGSVTVRNVDFDYDLEGPISDTPQSDPDGLTKTFTVLGTVVIVDADSTIFGSGYGFTSISQNDMVQISGFFDSNDVLRAKYIEKTDTFTPGVDVEARGQIAELNTPNQTFKLHGLTVDYSGADLSGVPGGLHDGLFVEAKGILLQVGGVMFANMVEVEGLAQNAVAAAVEGIITTFNNNSDFVINSGNGPVHVDAHDAALDPPGLILGGNLQVEVEGTLTNGTLSATKVQLRNALIKLETTAFSVEPDLLNPRVGTVVLEFFDGQTATVTVDEKTRVLDTTGGPAQAVLSDLRAGDFLRVKARRSTSGLTATQIIHTDPRDIVLQGLTDPAPATSGNTGHVSIVGVRYQTDGVTEFKDALNNPIDSANFFSSAAGGGRLVRIKDKQPGDGMADSAELEN